MVRTSTGAKVAEWTFRAPPASAFGAPVVTQVLQATSGADGREMRLIVALACDFQDVVCVFGPTAGGRAQVLTAIQLPGKVRARDNNYLYYQY